jgi:DHA2 family multidrug resistance protein
MVQAIFMLGIIVAPTLGPTLGGWITDNYTWNWCFFINVPIGILSVFLVSTFLQDPPDQKAQRNPVDWIGIGLLTAGVGGLQYVLEEGNSKDWFQDALILRLAILSGVCLVAMVWWELSERNEHPVVNFRVLHNRTLSASIFLFVSLGFGLYGGVFLFPMFAQGILHFTPTETGLAMLPGGLATGASALVCGFLLNGKKPRADPRVLIAMGIALFAVSMWKMGHLTTVAGEGDVRAALLVRGLGLGYAVHADQQRRLCQPRAARGAAGGGADQPRAPARRLVRHRRAGQLRRQASRLPPGRPGEQPVGR